MKFAYNFSHIPWKEEVKYRGVVLISSLENKQETKLLNMDSGNLQFLEIFYFLKFSYCIGNIGYRFEACNCG